MSLRELAITTDAKEYLIKQLKLKIMGLLIFMCLIIMILFIFVGSLFNYNYNDNNIPFVSPCIGMVGGILMCCLIMAYQDKYKTYYKSSDMPYWELSDKQFKSDTTTIDTLYFNNKGDTVYRTINYIVTE